MSNVGTSSAPAPKSNRLDRTKLSNPDLQKPVSEQQSAKQTVIRIRKPEGKFFRIHPNHETRIKSATIMLNGNGGKAKLLSSDVSTGIREQLAGLKALKIVDLYLAVDEEGSYFVTFFSASPLEISESWVDSGRIVAEVATKQWIAVTANMSDGGYRIRYADPQFPQLAASRPKWELPGEDDPVLMFETCVSSNLIESDSSATIQNRLASRK